MPSNSILIFFGFLLIGDILGGADSPSISYDSDSKNYGEISVEFLNLQHNQGVMYYQGEPFSGVSSEEYSNGQLAEKITYWKGKRNGKRQKWFQSGLLSYESFYKENQLNGKVRSWWINGRLRSESNFEDGGMNGIQKQWYGSGELFKEQQITDGKEDGMQRAWRKNGKLYVNYEAKNGRIFGLKRANLCYELDDEKVVFND